MDEVTWVIGGTDLDDVVGKLERCAAASLKLAGDNTARFKESKTETILFGTAKEQAVPESEPGGGQSSRSV